MAAQESRPLLERWGVRYFEALSRDVEVVDVDGVHFLNEEERAGLARVSNGAIRRAAVAGALSTLVSAVAEVLAMPLLRTEGGASPSWDMTLRFWGIVLGATALASIVEIAYLYWDGLRSVHRMAVVAGLDLFGDRPGEDASAEERSAVAAALARAALELPNPAGRLFGVNPHRDASRLGLLFASLVYKAKISVTSFVVKALVRRALGRTAVRGWLDALVPFAAIPVTALWNGVVAWLVVREARIRTMGPSAARELAGHALEGVVDVSPACHEALLRAVACAIVKSEDLHPNLASLLAHVAARLGAVPASLELDDTARFLTLVATLPAAERAVVLRLLVVAAILDGRLSRKERRLLEEAFARHGAKAPFAAIGALRKAFVRGDRLEGSLVRSLA